MRFGARCSTYSCIFNELLVRCALVPSRAASLTSSVKVQARCLRCSQHAGPIGPSMLHRTRCGSPLVSLLIFCSWFFSLEAPTRRVAGAPPSHSGPTAGRSPRLSLRPLNISTSQVGAGAHPVTAHPFCATFFLSLLLSFHFFLSFCFLNFCLSEFPFFLLFCLSSSVFLMSLHLTSGQLLLCFFYRSQINSFTGKRTNLTLIPLD